MAVGNQSGASRVPKRVSSSENKVKIKCLSNNALIGSSFKLVCTVDDVLSELLINIVGGV